MRLPLDGYPFTNPFAGGARDDRDRTVGLMRWVAAGMFALGAVMVALSMATGKAAPAPLAHEVLLGLLVAETALAVAFALTRRPPALAFFAVAVLGIAFVGIGSCVVESTRPTPLYYLWPLVGAAFFVRAREVVLTFAFFVATYTVVLVGFFPHGEQLGWWADVVGAVAVVTGLVYALKVRVITAVGDLRRAALTDVLTGAPNRAAFEAALEDAIVHAAAAQSACAVISFDIDDFKDVNDRFGHATGDRALREVAEIVRQASAGVASYARIGGEEFALVVPGVDRTGGHVLGEIVRAAVEDGMRAFDSPLTVSVGVAAFPAAGMTPDALMLGADRAMYAAKAGGRNRVVAFKGNARLHTA
ncbi:MAG: GGDEF domain-containing protein [Solirubrobacteraceae bacterium]|nr:GGDEF domain-containing protein [Solirubrobacteraceae bacterium]